MCLNRKHSLPQTLILSMRSESFLCPPEDHRMRHSTWCGTSRASLLRLAKMDACDAIRYDTIFGRILQQLDLEFPSVDKSLDSSRDSIKWVKIRSIGIRCNKYYFLRIQIMMCPNCRFRFPQSTRLLLLVCSRLRIATAKSVLALRRNDSAWNVSSLVFSVLPPCCHDCSRIRSLADVSSKIEICKTQSIESFV